MRRFGTTRSALGLYGVLVVLPTLAFGWLYWRSLVREHEDQMLQVPREADHAARNILDGMRERLEHLIEVEEQREFYLYADLFTPEEMHGDAFALQPSPLQRIPRPEGIATWFSFDTADPGEPIELFTGKTTPEERQAITDEYRPFLDDYRTRKAIEDSFQGAGSNQNLEPIHFPLSVVAIVKGHRSRAEVDCLIECSPQMESRLLTVGVSRFTLEFFMTEEGRPFAVGSRRVVYEPSATDLPEDAPCLSPLLGEGFSAHQGFVLEADWLVGRLADSEADRILRDADEELLTVFRLGPLEEVCATCAPVYPVRELGFETYHPGHAEFGKLQVAIKTQHLFERFESQRRRFLVVAGVLVLSLATGMLLLYRSVSRELQHARRTQNFVAAVTHELRTPLSTIRLHGEMLYDGWATEPEKQQEYYARILRETDRLSTLVERVLEKSRLKGARPEPAPADLNGFIERLAPDLENPDGRTRDLELDLASDLPNALFVPESVASILGNLVENARKYAPVEEGGEPIQIRTRLEQGRILLQVADRGPGVPKEERSRIFEAFFRSGNEATRTTTGTGLGLHLVDLQAKASGAEASVLPREGGGSIFQVAFSQAT